MTRGEVEMLGKIGRAMADAWLAVKDKPDTEARVYFNTEDDLILGVDTLVRALMVLPSQPIDFEKTKSTTERERKPTVELTNGSCIRFLLK